MPLFDICCISSPVGKVMSAPYMPCESKESDLIDNICASFPTDLNQHCDERNLRRCEGNIRFNAGSITGSTDMLNLIRLYEESDDKDTVKHWMNIFTENKLNQTTENVLQHINDDENLSTVQSGMCDYCCNERLHASHEMLNTDLVLIRSMDRLPYSKDSHENLLEKCHSADYKRCDEEKKKLQRCQEMTDILMDKNR